MCPLRALAPRLGGPVLGGKFSEAAWGPQKKTSGVPKPAPRAELAACSDRTKAQQQRESLGSIAYESGRARLLL
jgi:hypothetical protein